MKSEEAKELLSQLFMCDTAIRDMTVESDRLQAKIVSITMTFKEDMVDGGTKEKDAIGEAIARLVDLQKEVTSEINRFSDLRQYIRECLGRIRNPRHFAVLYKRYVLYQKWEQIAEEMDYLDVRGIYDLHKKALKTFTKVA